jgi:four helix bundle protein
MSEAIRTFRDLIVWQKAIQLAKEVYQVTEAFPKQEWFGLTVQIRRAAVSVSSNIAEGHARQGREFCHFLSIARGSLAEVESQLLLSVELGFAIPEKLQTTFALAAEIRRMAASLASKLRGQKSGVRGQEMSIETDPPDPLSPPYF